MKLVIQLFQCLQRVSFFLSLSLSFIPVKRYDNADVQKLAISQENKGKSGLYLWRNLINSKTYIGSGVDLRRRIYEDFSLRYLLYNPTMYIYKAILKHGHSNFSLEILEYCEPSKVLEREQYYIDLLKPEYNILKTAGSSLGNTHSEDSNLKNRLYQLRE